jgi:CheY-like chemotaxis protein
MPGKPRILVVDDNADAANGLARLLTLMGKETNVVHDGFAALEAIDGFKPHVILLDLGMPGIDGLETAQRIRARQDCSHIVLIAVTGWGQETDRQLTDAAGFSCHLIKPVDIDQLEAALDDAEKRSSSQSVKQAAAR